MPPLLAGSPRRRRLLTSLRHAPVIGSLGTGSPVPGSYGVVTRSFSLADVQAFARVSGDVNPIHLDAQAASRSRFGQRIVHGWLTASLFGYVFSQALPGSIYLEQSLEFLKPVFLDEALEARVEVTSVKPRGRNWLQCTCATECVKVQGSQLVVKGIAQVLVEQRQ